MKSKPILFVLGAASQRLVVATATLIAAHAAHATSATWNGNGNALWANTGNWNGPPAAVPGSGETATFNNAGNGNTVIDLGAGSVRAIETASPAPLAHASWCADGRHLVAAQGEWLAVVDSVTGKVTRLTPASLGRCSEPDCWTPRAR